MPDPSPWHGIELERLHRDPHDPDRCEVCTPVMATSAYRAGVERAHEQQTQLPATSSPDRDSRPGRDGYRAG